MGSSILAVLQVQVSSPHLAVPVRDDVGQVVVAAVVVGLLVAWAWRTWVRHDTARRYACVEGRVVGTIGGDDGGDALAVVEYSAGERRYRLPAVVGPHRHMPVAEVSVLYDRADPTVARLAAGATPRRWLR